MIDLGETAWEDVKEHYPKFANPKALQQWIAVARHLEKKDNKRPSGWEDWVSSIMAYGERFKAGKDTEDVKQFRFGGCKYNFHVNTVDCILSLFGKPVPSNFGNSF